MGGLGTGLPITTATPMNLMELNMSRWINLVVLSLVCSYAHAYKVEPMVAEMEPLGKRAQMSMRIDNTSRAPLTVELYPFSMTMDEHGKETIRAADDELLVIPVTAIIEPGRSQSVMIRYLGDPSITQSKSYRIAVKQVEVKRGDGNNGQLGLLLQFNTLVNVRPKNTAPALDIKSVQEGKNKWIVEVENTGNSYGRLTKTNWRVTDGNHSKYLKGIDISKLIAGTLVLPHSTRYFDMQPLDGFDASKVSIEIDQDE
jgi:P pilus assembly chaperone PapD